MDISSGDSCMVKKKKLEKALKKRQKRIFKELYKKGDRLK